MSELYDQLKAALIANGVREDVFEDIIDPENVRYHDGEYCVYAILHVRTGRTNHARKFTPRRFDTLVRQITSYLDANGFVRREAEERR